MRTLMIAIGVSILLLAVLAALRTKMGNKFEFKNSDIVIALIPIVLWLFLSGEIRKLTIGGLFEIEKRIEEASKSSVAPQVTELPVESVRTDPKADIGKIQELIENKSQALSFQMGHGGYHDSAISEYLNILTKYPFLRYIVINDSDGSFFGVADARQLAAIILEKGGSFDSQTLTDWLNSSIKDQLKTLPGFIPSEDALKKTSGKREALQLMDSLDVQTLPVIDDNGKFAGIVDRSKLTASMLLDITGGLEKGK